VPVLLPPLQSPTLQYSIFPHISLTDCSPSILQPRIDRLLLKSILPYLVKGESAATKEVAAFESWTLTIISLHSLVNSLRFALSLFAKIFWFPLHEWRLLHKLHSAEGNYPVTNSMPSLHSIMQFDNRFSSGFTGVPPKYFWRPLTSVAPSKDEALMISYKRSMIFWASSRAKTITLGESIWMRRRVWLNHSQT